MNRFHLHPLRQTAAQRASLLAATALLVVGCSTSGPATAVGSPTTEIQATPTPTTASVASSVAEPSPAEVEPLPEPGGDPIDYPTGIQPTSIEIPALGLRADTVELDLVGPEPEVPQDFAETGWYAQTRKPGEIGPAVIAGHIDSVAGPAVFARLDELAPGDEIVVRDEAGQHLTFTVQGAGQYPKGDLPSEVFGFDQPRAELRLITCGGTFDRSTGHYRDNYVVYAALEADTSTSP